MHYLITGGAGFIGCHLAERLLSAGHSVTVIDDLCTGSIQNIESWLKSGAAFAISSSRFSTVLCWRSWSTRPTWSSTWPRPSASS